jgi:hypothetical protein
MHINKHIYPAAASPSVSNNIIAPSTRISASLTLANLEIMD